MEKKLRHSRQRDMIYQYMLATREHPCAETVYTALKEKIAGLSLGTVYRNLKLLEELGKIRRVACVQGSDRFDAICADHAHFLCSCCGGLKDLENMDGGALRAAVRLEEGCLPERFDLTITGLCPVCAGK